MISVFWLLGFLPVDEFIVVASLTFDSMYKWGTILKFGFCKILCTKKEHKKTATFVEQGTLIALHKFWCVKMYSFGRYFPLNYMIGCLSRILSVLLY